MDSSDGQLMPEALRALADVPLELDGAGLRFLPGFLPVEMTVLWIRDIVAPGRATPNDFLVFGETCVDEIDYTAFWLVRPGAAIEDQPVVSIGYGAPQLLAASLADFLWFLADAFNPKGIDGRLEDSANYELIRIAGRFAPDNRQTCTSAESRAAEEFPNFADLFVRN
ncbi:hypothetical protein [Streptacidiphilus sp. EB103A]|uniref:hypothetical protein n=1 Tax=Streptacidiphilus sp. EB103A TaxID=3156275 RepID=UPI0035118F8B